MVTPLSYEQPPATRRLAIFLIWQAELALQVFADK